MHDYINTSVHECSSIIIMTTLDRPSTLDSSNIYVTVQTYSTVITMTL